MRKPTDKEINEAQDYVKQRLRAEISMQKNLNEALIQAAREIIVISEKYDIPPRMFRLSANWKLKSEIDKIISNLRKLIHEYTETLSVYDREEEKEEIIAFINKESHGKTLAERINIYCNRYRFEIESAIAAGLIAGISNKAIEDSIKNNLRSPYNNPYFRKAVVEGDSVATRIQTDGISYGVGRSNSAFNSLNTLTRYAIGSSWMWYWGRIGEKNGATGFYSFRGSSYPCDECQSHAGVFQPMSAYYGEYHLHCKCIFVFV